jgi:3-hydroxyisobutyrate dehydrogenase-like beta-hydroxyacid dehydrogenase
MGAGMVANLAQKYGPVRVFDLHRPSVAAAVKSHVNITGADSLSDLASTSDCVVVSVAGEAAESAIFAELYQSAKPGTLYVNCGTSSVEHAQKLHAAAVDVGVRFVDAPVSGGPEGAKNGTLTIMCGGNPVDVNGVKGVLSAMGANIVHTGGTGTGAGAKLVNQASIPLRLPPLPLSFIVKAPPPLITSISF